MSRQKLKQARKGADMTQEQMAEHLCISIGYYKMLESGERTGSIELWDKLEDLFNVHQGYNLCSSIYPYYSIQY